MSEQEQSPESASLERIEGLVIRVLEGQTSFYTSLADARRDIGLLHEKLVRIQEALYYLASRSMAPEHSEELRSMLPDPPKRRLSFGR